MAVPPDWLDSIGADVFKAQQLKGSRGQGAGWAFVKLSHHVALALAACARTAPPQGLKIQEAL